MPGGFCEPYEKIEDSAIREIFEETNIKLDKINYLISTFNEYIYDGLMYVISDKYFYSQLDYVPEVKANDDAAEVIFLKREEIDFNKIAFESSKGVLKHYFDNY